MCESHGFMDKKLFLLISLRPEFVVTNIKITKLINALIGGILRQNSLLPKFAIFVVVSALLVASIYSISSSIVFALIKKSDVACVKTTKNGITTETCCHNEIDTQTGKKIQYCAECKTLQDGTDLGCTHT